MLESSVIVVEEPLVGGSDTSYRASAAGHQRHPTQSRPAIVRALVLALGLTPGLGGCGVMMPLSQWTSPTTTAAPTPEEVTGSIPKPAQNPTMANADADVIRSVVEKANTVAPTAQVAWSNPTTGNSGTISGLVATRAVNGAACRDFRTTVATIGGVRLYAGRACQGYVGPWDLVRLEPTDAATAG